MLRNSVLCERIQIHESAFHMNILIVCLNDFAVFSILNLKVARNRKIPEDLTETHESVLYLRQQ